MILPRDLNFAKIEQFFFSRIFAARKAAEIHQINFIPDSFELQTAKIHFHNTLSFQYRRIPRNIALMFPARLIEFSAYDFSADFAYALRQPVPVVIIRGIAQFVKPDVVIFKICVIISTWIT